MKPIVLGGLAAVFLGSVCLAADLPQHAPVYKSVPQAPVTPWTGCYIGAVGGWGWAAIDVLDIHIDGGSAGGELGCNAQTGNWVWGIEGDALWSGIKETFLGVVDVKNDFLGSVRGRVGIASPTAMLYATGGLGIGHGAITSPFFEFDNTHYGWTAGAGIEWVIAPNWTGKVEYLHYDFGSESYGGIDIGFDVDAVRVGLNYKFAN